jgi:hypothetical protein
MEHIYTYIKRLLSFLLCVAILLLSQKYIPFYLSISLLLVVFSILHFKITNEHPPHLFAFFRTESYFRKGGLRDLLRIFVTFFGFICDIAIWMFWGGYLLFILLVDLISFINRLLYWITFAIIWFFRQYWPFLVFLYHIFIYYIIRWPWWLYQITFYNLRYAYNRNSYKIALTGSLFTATILFLFYFLELYLEDIPGIIFIGILISLVPLTWLLGEIANLRVQKLEQDPYKLVKEKFQNGIESVRSILFYITLFVVLLLAQLGLNILGWIPLHGIVIEGIVFNMNALISLVLVFLIAITLPGVLIIPTYRFFVPFNETKLADSLKLLRVLPNILVRFVVVFLPATFYSAIVMLLPFVIMVMVYFLMMGIKDVVADVRINILKMEQSQKTDKVDAYKIGKQIDHLSYLKTFPSGIWQEMKNRKSLSTENKLYHEDIESREVELLNFRERAKRKLSEIDYQINESALQYSSENKTSKLEGEKVALLNQLKNFTSTQELNIAKLKADLNYLTIKSNQIPVLFFLGGLWYILFGSLIVSFAISYVGNVIHQVICFRFDNKTTEWQNIISRIKADDQKQPLLGGTLFVLTLGPIGLFLLSPGIDIFFTGFFQNLFGY